MSDDTTKIDELRELCKGLTEEHVIKACKEHHDELTKQFENETNYILYKKEYYRLKLTIKYANKYINEREIPELNSNQHIQFFNEKFKNSKQIFLYKDNRAFLLKRYKDKGFIIETPVSNPYTAIKREAGNKKNNTLVEVYNYKKDRITFCIRVKYDSLDEEYKQKCKREPESHKWSNDATYLINSQETCDIASEIIDNLIKNAGITVDIKPEITNNNENGGTTMPKPDKISKNLILYGPPGTGKTYSINNYVEKITKDNYVENISIDNYVNEYDDNTEFNVLSAKWLDAIAYYMFISDKSNFKIDHILELLKDYIPTKNHTKPRKKISEMLQKHTSPDSKLVNLRLDLREEPYLFDKNDKKEWYLTETGKNYISNLINSDNIQEQIKKNEFVPKEEYIQKKYTKFITFHQSYSYEEFVEGIKPSTKEGDVKFEYKNGIFKQMCIKANSDPDNNYVVIIDEINRGNISKIFGELITLIEEDKRIKPNGENEEDDKNMIITLKSLEQRNALTTSLPYTNQEFGVPSNLYIIGTMNTADKSLTLLDVALRRRFEFKPMYPQANLIDKKYTDYKNKKEFLESINNIILEDKKSPDYLIGHAYFMNNNTLKDILNKKVIPLLMEYYNGKQDIVTDILDKVSDNKYKTTLVNYYLQVE